MKKVVSGALLVIVFIVFSSCNASSKAAPTSTDEPESGKEVAKMQVTVQVPPDVARTLHQRGPPTAKSQALLGVIEGFGFTLEPMHLDTDDPKLQSYFLIDVPDHATARRVIDRLKQSEAVEAAYVKPPDELP